MLVASLLVQDPDLEVRLQTLSALARSSDFYAHSLAVDSLNRLLTDEQKELLTTLPNLMEIWYDVPRYMSREQSFDFYKLAYDIQPNCLINSRVVDYGKQLWWK